MTERLGSAAFRLERDDFTLDVAFDIPVRGVLGAFGRSGCGKTSLLRCLAGLEQSVSGSIRINGDTWLDTDAGIRLASAERAIGYVFQDGRLFPHLDVSANLGYGERRRKDRTGIAGMDNILALLDIGHLLHRKPAQLSGGEQQRVAIGRALLAAPRLLLMDEPLANLDRERKQEILPYLDRLHAELQIPIVYVSHSLNEITRLCDEVLLMRDGRIIAADTLETVFSDIDVATGFGDMAGVVVPVHSNGWNDTNSLSYLELAGETLRVPDRLPEGPLRLRIQASDVSIVLEKPAASSILNILPAQVKDIRMAGDAMAFVRLGMNGHDLLARISQASIRQLGLHSGMNVFAQIKGAAIRR